MSDNLLKMVPVAKFPTEEMGDGVLRIEVPKFKGEIGKRICRFLRLGENISVKLDMKGSFIYERCDGRRSVRKLLEEFQQEFGDQVEQALPRLRDFLGYLERNGLICYEKDT